MVKVNRLKLDSTRRILVASDIHGGIDIFKSLLDRVNYNNNDYLFIVGDIIEKGPKSLETLKFFYELSKTSDTYLTIGNNDLILKDMKENTNLEKCYKYIKYRNTIYNDFTKELNYEVNCVNDLVKLNELIYQNYKKYIDFVLDLPVIIETDRLLFCHAGIKDFEDLENNDLDYLLKTPYFLNESYCSNKLLFVGHFPSLGYQKKVCSYKPVRNFKKRTICVDGGFSETIEGQINLMVIENEKNINIYSVYDDLFEEVEVICDQEYIDGDLYIWGKDKLEIVSEDTNYNDCNYNNCNYFNCIINGNEKAKIHKSFFFLYDKSDPSTFTNTDFSRSFLRLVKGEKVKLIRVCDDTCYIKCDGVCGFAKTENLNIRKK